MKFAQTIHSYIPTPSTARSVPVVWPLKSIVKTADRNKRMRRSHFYGCGERALWQRACQDFGCLLSSIEIDFMELVELMGFLEKLRWIVLRIVRRRGLQPSSRPTDQSLGRLSRNS
jgi:hypothetical protein